MSDLNDCEMTSRRDSSSERLGGNSSTSDVGTPVELTWKLRLSVRRAAAVAELPEPLR